MGTSGTQELSYPVPTACHLWIFHFLFAVSEVFILMLHSILSAGHTE